MATVEKSGLANVDRFWRDVRKGPRGEHLHVSLLGLRTFGTAELHSRLEEGLSYEALERLRKVLDLPLSRISELLQIPPRTLARRKEAKRLLPDESDRLVRLSRLVGLALQLFEGNLAGTRSWLTAPIGHWLARLRWSLPQRELELERLRTSSDDLSTGFRSDASGMADCQRKARRKGV